jgi:hypothetical protein
MIGKRGTRMELVIGKVGERERRIVRNAVAEEEHDA